MGIMKRTLICLYLAPLEFSCAASAFAADQVTAQSYPWPWWREMQWPTFGWIFPIICFAMMIAMLLFVMRKGGMGCMWRGWSTDRSDFRDPTKRPWSEQSASALD